MHVPTHDLSAQQYYDRFFRSVEEGLCRVCGKKTEFLGLYRGYAECCCVSHGRTYVDNLPHVREAHRNLQKRVWRERWKSEEWRHAHAERNRDPARVARQSDALKRRWASDSEYQNKQYRARNLRPNHLEDEVQFFLDEFAPGCFEYVGDFSVWVDGKNPDFLWESRKAVVEAYGDAWHDLSGATRRVKFFQEHGYACFIIWQSSLYCHRDVVRSEFLEFLSSLNYVMAGSDSCKNKPGELRGTPKSLSGRYSKRGTVCEYLERIGKSAAKPISKETEGSTTNGSSLNSSEQGETDTSARLQPVLDDEIVWSDAKVSEVEIKTSTITQTGRNQGVRSEFDFACYCELPTHDPNDGF